jgi:quinol monooxygenase YgiN
MTEPTIQELRAFIDQQQAYISYLEDWLNRRRLTGWLVWSEWEEAQAVQQHNATVAEQRAREAAGGEDG